MITPVYDANVAPAHERNHGPGRVSHAYPEQSRVALYGATRGENASQGMSPKCPVCVEQAGRRSWVTR